MFHEVSGTIAEYLISNQIGSGDDYDWYTYGLEILLGKISTYSIVLILSFLIWGLCGVIESLLFMVSFCLLRKKTGGFHAYSQLQCFVFSVLICLGSTVFFAPILNQSGQAVFTLTTISTLIILLLAPVCHADSGIKKSARPALKCQSLILLFLYLSLILLLSYLNIFLIYRSILVLSLAFDSFLLLGAKFLKQEGYYEE